MNDYTCEESVHDDVLNYFRELQEYQLVSHHPPDSKRYNTANIQIPKRGIRGNTGRDIVDFIYVSNEEILLIEAKCRFSETLNDQVKINQITATYTPVEFTYLIKRSGYNISETNRHFVKALAVRILDSFHPIYGFRIFSYVNDKFQEILQS